jgi:hypothetical protein
MGSREQLERHQSSKSGMGYVVGRISHSHFHISALVLVPDDRERRGSPGRVGSGRNGSLWDSWQDVG